MVTPVIEMVPIRLILPNPLQPRQVFDEAELQDLADSISEHGILQPPVVRSGAITPEGDRGYFLVAGERRTRAAERAGFYEIPVIIKEVTPLEGGLLAAVENIQRSNLTPLEESDMILSLQAAAEAEGKTLTVQQLAKQLGKGRGTGYIYNRLDIAGMGPDLQAMIQQRPDTIVHAKYIDSVAKPEFRAKLIEITADGASLVSVREFVRYLAEAKSGATGELFDQLLDFYEGKRVFIARNPKLLESRVDEYISLIDAAKQSSSAPDTETQSRINTNRRTGGGGMSRGLQVTSTSERDAKKEFEVALDGAKRHLQNALAWRDQVGELTSGNQTRIADLETLIQRLTDL